MERAAAQPAETLSSSSSAYEETVHMQLEEASRVCVCVCS